MCVLGFTFEPPRQVRESVCEKELLMKRAMVPILLWSAVMRFSVYAGESATAEVFLKDVKLGEHWYGPEWTLEDLKGRVVLFEFWGLKCPACIAAMPGLVKLQAELKDSGFVIIATHSQDGTKEQVVNFLRSQKANFMGTSFGQVPGHEVRGIPHAFLFDSKGALVASGHPDALKPKVRELVASEPHWLAAGREYKKLKPLADSLKKTTAYGPILKKLEAEVKKGGEAGEEAKYLLDNILNYGRKRLGEAKTLESEDAYLADKTYNEVVANWKGSEVAAEAAARLKELKKDKEFQQELKAATLAHQILERCESLVAQAGKINLDYAPNKKVAAEVRSLVPVLKKKFPESKAAQKISEQLQSYGFQDL